MLRTNDIICGSATARRAIGVSTNPASRGADFLHALLDQHYEERRPLYLVNPKATEIRGLRVYPSLLDCPGSALDDRGRNLVDPNHATFIKAPYELMYDWTSSIAVSAVISCWSR